METRNLRVEYNKTHEKRAYYIQSDPIVRRLKLKFAMEPPWIVYQMV